MAGITTIQIHEDVKQNLDSFKETAKDSYEDAIVKLISSVEKQKRFNDKLLLEGYKEMAKESIKIAKEWSQADLDWD